MSEPLKDKQGTLFHKLWELLISEGKEAEYLQDAEVREAIRRMYRVAEMPQGDYSLLWKDIRDKMQEQASVKRAPGDGYGVTRL